MKKKEINKQGKAFFTNGFKFKGKNFEALTTGRLGILIQVNSAYIAGGSRMKAVYDVAFVLNKSYPELVEIIANDSFDSEVYKFMDLFQPEDLPELDRLVYNVTDEITSVMVETESEDDGDESSKK